MWATFALWAFRTEAGKIKEAYVGLLVVLEGALWAEWAETAVVVRACRTLRFGIDVEIEAVVSVRASLRAGVIGAFGHAAEVVFVKKLASFAFLAKTSQPMLADEASPGIS